jgi:AraC-like DNA-binding protein
MGRNVEALLKRVGLPIGCLDEEASLVPLAYFEQFLSAICTDAELGAFSYQAAPSDLQSYGGLITQLTGAGTLRQALESGSIGTAEITNQSIQYGTWRQKNWIFTTPRSRDAARLAWSPYLLKPLMALVRSVAGDAWWPRSVLLPCLQLSDIEALDLPRHASIEFGMGAVAIEISNELLDRVFALPAAEESAIADENGEIPSELLPALRLLLKSYSHDRPPQLATIAELAACSVRSLQRDLRRAGSSYTALTQEARYMAAVRLLSGTDSTVTDVAYELGYSDPAHFTRAFQRNSGSSPRTFRELGHAMV